jgi:hypothetical protein
MVVVVAVPEGQRLERDDTRDDLPLERLGSED